MTKMGNNQKYKISFPHTKFLTKIIIANFVEEIYSNPKNNSNKQRKAKKKVKESVIFAKTWK